MVIDVVKSLRISTTTREIYLEEPPEAFEVVANDKEGNLFSTLEGNLDDL